ncbi:ATP-binding cassette domain-containing protein [Acetobacteraceae bacterium]|nr:ATP-binding cassette domain-containing protein [Acetobacteraceae bacterium]
MTLLTVSNLSKTYPQKNGLKNVLKNISFSLHAGETLALLGQSGCGKSTLMRLLMRLEKPSTGEIFFEGQNLANMNRQTEKDFYQNTQLIFQDSLSAVNARFSLKSIIEEPLLYLSNLTKEERTARVKELLVLVKLPEDFLNRHPSEISGGQLQRICIARALALNPKILLLDEAVSNLDLHLQVETLHLLKKLQKKQKMSYLFVTHDIRLVRKFSDRALIMEKGEIVEEITDFQAKMTHPVSLLLSQAVLPPFPIK